MKIDKVLIGHRIEAALTDAGLKKKDLATALGVSPASVSGYCAGTTEPSLSSLATIAEVCGVNLERLVLGKIHEGQTTITRLESAEADAGEQWVGQTRRSAPRIGEGDACYLKGTVHLSNTELRLLAAFRDIDAGQQSSIIGIAEAFRVANESRENVGGGSGSAVQKSA